MFANLHPPLSAFPIALITVSSLLELINLFKRSDSLSTTVKINLGLAAVFVIAAFFSGYNASESASQTFKISDEVISWHHTWGGLLLFLIIPCFILKVISHSAKQQKVIWLSLYILFLLTCQALVVYTGCLGGQLVFKYGAGVSAQ